MRSYINSRFCASVTKVLVILHERFLYLFLFFLWSLYWSEVGGAQLEKYFHAPIRIS